MTVSVFAADSDSFCALSLSLFFAHLLSHFSPVPFIFNKQMCFCLKLNCTVGVSSSEAPLALMGFFFFLLSFLLLPSVFHPHPTLDGVMPPPLPPLSQSTSVIAKTRECT